MFLSEADVSSLADHLGLTRAAFLTRHAARHEGRTTLRTDLARCEFQGDDGSCGVYSARPHQCRSWPFWRENLVRDTWERDVVPLCPGVGAGALHGAQEIEEIAQRDEHWYSD